jgi:hypothetical protein
MFTESGIRPDPQLQAGEDDLHYFGSPLSLAATCTTPVRAARMARVAA